MLQRTLCLTLSLTLALPAADLPIREVVLYKHGVGYFSRSGDLPAGETAQLAFKAGEMNDVLKSLTIVDAGGAPIAGVRYDASEPVEQRLADFPFRVDENASLARFLDQMKGARLELSSVAGAIVSARTVPATQTAPEREVVVLLTDAGDIRSLDLSTVPSVRLSDPKLQAMMRDYLTIVNGARSRDRRNVYIDASKQGSRRVTASYMTPAAVWKSSYRLIFAQTGDPTLEGWAIVDNTSGDDWTNVNLSVVSGRPISFISQLYEPKYVDRPVAELAENRAVGPQVFGGAVVGTAFGTGMAAAQAPRAAVLAEADMAKQFGGVGGGVMNSTVNPTSIAAQLGDLFEYRFSTSVTVKQGESAMLPFLQQKLGARKLLIYSESFGQNPQNAAELTNSTGKTLDGGPITVYDANAYAGEALVETLKAGDKRLISYGVDLGTRITTKIDSGAANVREIHLRRGVLTTRNAVQETRTYTINNVDANRKTLIIEHPLRPSYTLLSDVKPKEITATAQRFEVALGGNAVTSFAVKEERVYDQTSTITNITPDQLVSMIQGRPLSAAGRTQLDRIVAKKREVAANQEQRATAQSNIDTLAGDQERFRQNINSLRGVAGQEQLVQQYARQLSDSEARLTALRDQQAQLQRAGTTLQAELNALIENAEF